MTALLFRRAICWIFGCVFAISPFVGPHMTSARCLRCRRIWSFPSDDLTDDETPPETPKAKDRP